MHFCLLAFLLHSKLVVLESGLGLKSVFTGLGLVDLHLKPKDLDFLEVCQQVFFQVHLMQLKNMYRVRQ